jgi:hypothetical protein
MGRHPIIIAVLPNDRHLAPPPPSHHHRRRRRPTHFTTDETITPAPTRAIAIPPASSSIVDDIDDMDIDDVPTDDDVGR